eukprot:TRINITY_DN77918_c0_g1_i1.p1 TRINITY_DN77918_c0_g1~~TRINITY_DN77918_c0_g1_i1.p1  ORF type:complete len:505 (-),score=134.26 TRINITY_DN77918_c0_g1_i1:18-1487(-)
MASATSPAGARPGFGASDLAEALKQRAAWFDGLGESAVLDSDLLSSSGSEWDGNDAPTSKGGVTDHVIEEEDEQQPGKAMQATPSGNMAAASEATSQVESTALDPDGSRKRFAGAEFAEHGGAGGALMRPRWSEPPARRLGRLKADVAAFCDWAEQQQASSGSQDSLGAQAKELAHMISRAIAEEAPARLRPPQAVWLPPTGGNAEAVAGAKSLLDLHNTSMVEDGVNRSAGKVPGKTAKDDTMAYKLTVPQGAGWLLAAQADAVSALQDRLSNLQALLGTPGAATQEEAQANPSSQPGDEVPDGASVRSLADATARLGRRLHHLETLADDRLCSQFAASASLLAAEIDLTMEEASRLEALEAEEDQEAAELSRPTSPTSQGEAMDQGDSTESQVLRLHEQLSGLGALADHAEELQKDLQRQSRPLAQLEHFCLELAAAEARASRAGALLKDTAEAASKMKESTVACSQQLKKDVAALEAKLDRISRRN